MNRDVAIGIALVGWVVGGVTGVARAQGRPLGVAGQQALAFGVVFPGLPVSVSRTDALRTGQYQITGQKNSSVRITFTLPAAMQSGPATLPLVFGSGDGGWSPQGAIATAQAFDPRVPLVTALSGNGRLSIYLGGTAVPSPQLGAGTYTATITLTVCYTGVTC